MKRKDVILIGLAAAMTGMLLLVVSAVPGEPPRRPATQCFMCEKLVHAQAVLEGLTLEKFDLVSKNAIRLHDMTQSNQWFTLKQPDYMVQTTNYQKNVKALYLAAIDKNLDSATEAYMKVARNCVDCHRFVRIDQHTNAVAKRYNK